MPATFSHCLIAREAISRMEDKAPYAGILKENNNFVIMGATGPDYPYLTDVIKYGLLHIGHNWSNRMHYEKVIDFVRYGLGALSQMDKKSIQFDICLSWFAGYITHVIADSFVHPVINSITGGVYIFTQEEHVHCELIQDVYIFKKMTGTDIINAAARDEKTFGYLNILDDCSDPNDLDKIHPHIRDFWNDLLQKAHPHATKYFPDIEPDEWHKNYKSRVDFIANGRSIFRHVFDIAKAPRYIAENQISQVDRDKYIDKVLQPNGKRVTYEDVFNKAVEIVVAWWNAILSLAEASGGSVSVPVKDWNLDTGVDEGIIDLWMGV